MMDKLIVSSSPHITGNATTRRIMLDVIIALLPETLPTMTLLILPPGGFFVFGMLIALANKLSGKLDKKSASLEGCDESACATCGLCAGKEASE